MDSRPIAQPLDGEDLAPWEEQFARWMAVQTARVEAGQELQTVSVLLGHPLSITQIKRTKRKLAWKRVYQIARAELFEVQLAHARARAMAIAPKAMRTYGKAVSVLDAELTKISTSQRQGGKTEDGQPDGVDAMKALRVAPHLLNPFLDRVAPKRTERHETSQKVVIHMSAEQSQKLDAPVMLVSAEEVHPALPARGDE